MNKYRPTTDRLPRSGAFLLSYVGSGPHVGQNFGELQKCVFSSEIAQFLALILRPEIGSQTGSAGFETLREDPISGFALVPKNRTPEWAVKDSQRSLKTVGNSVKNGTSVVHDKLNCNCGGTQTCPTLLVSFWGRIWLHLRHILQTPSKGPTLSQINKCCRKSPFPNGNVATRWSCQTDLRHPTLPLGARRHTQGCDRRQASFSRLFRLQVLAISRWFSRSGCAAYAFCRLCMTLQQPADPADLQQACGTSQLGKTPAVDLATISFGPSQGSSDKSHGQFYQREWLEVPDGLPTSAEDLRTLAGVSSKGALWHDIKHGKVKDLHSCALRVHFQSTSVRRRVTDAQLCARLQHKFFRCLEAICEKHAEPLQKPLGYRAVRAVSLCTNSTSATEKLTNFKCYKGCNLEAGSSLRQVQFWFASWPMSYHAQAAETCTKNATTGNLQAPPRSYNLRSWPHHLDS